MNFRNFNEELTEKVILTPSNSNQCNDNETNNKKKISILTLFTSHIKPEALFASILLSNVPYANNIFRIFASKNN